MATDVKNIEASDSGNAVSGRVSVRTRRTSAGGTEKVNQTLDPTLGLVTKTISEFDTTPTNLANRFDDPRYYAGDAAT